MARVGPRRHRAHRLVVRGSSVIRDVPQILPKSVRFLMTSDRKKPGVAFWATVVVVLALAYPLSYGPACWLDLRQERLPSWARPVAWYFWRPMAWLAISGPKPIKRTILWWASLG